MSLCFSFLIGRGALDEYGDAGEEHADSKDIARLGQFFEALEHPSHDLLITIWQDQLLCSRESRASKAEGQPASPGTLPCRNLRHCGAARLHSSEPMPSPRREIESRTRPILPVAVLADVASSEAAKGSIQHKSRNSQRADLECGALHGG